MTGRSLNLAVIGRQGSGKGTQAATLADRLGLHHVSTGDLLREAAAEGRESADVLRGYLDAGALVPDVLVSRLVAQALRASERGCVFDGYPRTLAQAELLDRLVDLDLVIELRIDPDEAQGRLARRRTCAGCGQIGAAPSPTATLVCDRCGTDMARRDDDDLTAVRHRFELYERVTVPVLERYADRGLVVSIDAGRPRDAVAADVLRAVHVAGASDLVPAS